MKLHLPKPNRTVGALDILGLLGLVGLLVARYIPVARLIPFWGCAFRQQTGWPCLGCGLTRVADRVAHFQFASAWAANPLGTVGAFVFALLAVLALLHLVFALPVPRLELTEAEWQRVRLGAIALILLNYAWVVVVTKFPHLLA